MPSVISISNTGRFTSNIHIEKVRRWRTVVVTWYGTRNTFSLFLVVIKCNLNPFSRKQILAFLIFPLIENRENVNMYIIMYTQREEER